MKLIEGRGHLELSDEGADSDAGVLLEDHLRQLGRTFPDIIPRNGVDNEEPSAQVQQLRLNLFRTAKSSSLAPGHGAAALNALCGFLDICSTCQNRQWASLCLCPSTCKQLLDIFLVKSQNFKPKPAKQLLITIINTLSRYPDGSERLMLINTIVARCVRSLSKQENAQSTKSSMQALEHLVNQKIITAESIITVSAGISSAAREEAVKMTINCSSTAFRAAVEDFVNHVLHWVRYPDCASSISRFLPCLFASLNACRAARTVETADQSISVISQFPLWMRPVKRFLDRDISLLDNFEDYVFPGLLRLNPRDIAIFLETLPLNKLQQGNVEGHSDADIQLCLLAVKIARSGLKNIDEEESHAGQIKNFDPARLCINLIEHPTANVRIAAFSLLISSSSLSAPLPCNILACLQESIPYFHQETNPRTRNGFLALMKLLCLRLGHAAKTFARLSAATGQRYQDFAGAGENLMHHIRLARWYQKYLFHELRPTASYQSHITALRVLPLMFDNKALTDLLLSNKDPPEAEQRETTIGEGNILNHVRPLLDLLVDPFDDVRQMTSSILDLTMSSTFFNGSMCRSYYDAIAHIHISQSPQIMVDKSIEIALVRAEEHVRRSGRADHADGVGRLYNIYHSTGRTGYHPGTIQDKHPINDLLSALERKVGAMGQNQLDTLTTTSVHGHLIALRYIISHSDFVDLRPVSARLLACCSQIWQSVRNILCFDAPEGRYLFDDENDEADCGSKDILSFCWRALKESSLLVHALVDQVSSRGSELSSNLHDLDCDVYGRLLFTQLAELRHRGAFSTVAQTFAAWCIMCSKSKKPGLSNLPKEWYQETLACIQLQASALTRRSAGLPAMITGVLAAYPNGPFFDEVVLDLQAIADAPAESSQELLHISLPQVHALNCLKDVFTDSRFGSSTEGHIAFALGIAISSLESKIWAIRNCGLMLLKALLKRLNGGADTGSTRVASTHRQFSPLTYEKFPILPSLLLRLLRHRHDGSAFDLHVQTVFPALEIVERFGVPDVHRGETLQALDCHRASPIWSIREKSAKAFGMIMEADDFLNHVREMIYVDKFEPQNKVHGQLLSLRVVFVRAMPTYLDTLNSSHLRELSDWLLKLFDQHISKNDCPITVAAALNLLADVAESLLQLRDDIDVQQFLDQLRILLLEKYAVRGLYSPPSPSASSLEHNSILRCLAIMEDVNELDSTRATRKARDMFRAEETGPNKLLPDNLPKDGLHHLIGPDEYNMYLQIWGGRLAEELVCARKPTDQFMAWIKTLILAGHARSELAARLAAVASIGTFFTWMRNHTLKSTDAAIPVELLTVLYDTLVDDDEDVRSHGAMIVSSILSAYSSKRTNTSTNLSLSPPSARSRFLRYLASIYSRSANLLLEAIWRLTGMLTTIDVVLRTELMRMTEDGALMEKSASILQFVAVSTLLESALQQQNVVFEEEKQNLYLDPVTEAEDWAQVVIDMEQGAWLSGLIETVRDWTEDGLQCLLHALDERGDGPLGLTSKVDVFSLFMHVVSMARALMLVFHKRPTESRFARGLPDIYSITTKLESLVERGQEKDLHPLIIDTAQRILWEVEDVAQ